MKYRAATLAALLCLTAGAALAAPPAQKFDLLCEVRGNRISGPNSGKAQYWHDELRVVVDLGTMRYCEQPDCARSGPQKIAARRDGSIFIYDQPNLKWSISLQDGKSLETMTDGKRRSLITGACRKARFTGFSWRVADGSLTGAAFREPVVRPGAFRGPRPHHGHGARASRHR